MVINCNKFTKKENPPEVLQSKGSLPAAIYGQLPAKYFLATTWYSVKS